MGGDASVVVRAPGRVNLIGDHTDHQDGFVLPLATEASTTLRVQRRDDRRIRLTSRQLGPAEVDLDVAAAQGTWIDHVTGVAVAYELRHPQDRLGGMEGTLDSDVPVGAGLSSSAAVQLAAIRALLALADLPWEPTVAARCAQAGEAEVVGAQVGIMDQLTVARARRGCALLIDCRSLEITPRPLPEEAVVAVLDTGTRRRVLDSAYNDRRQACDAAASQLGLAALRDATLADLSRLEDEVVRRRARHVVTENERVLHAAAALAAGDLGAVGRLMVASHESLRDDFGASSPALDAMVDAALTAPGCHGARLTGAGFAGCAVALVERDGADDFRRHVIERYRGPAGAEPVVWVTRPAPGVRVVPDPDEGSTGPPVR